MKLFAVGQKEKSSEYLSYVVEQVGLLCLRIKSVAFFSCVIKLCHVIISTHVEQLFSL